MQGLVSDVKAIARCNAKKIIWREVLFEIAFMALEQSAPERNPMRKLLIGGPPAKMFWREALLNWPVSCRNKRRCHRRPMWELLVCSPPEKMFWREVLFAVAFIQPRENARPPASYVNAIGLFTAGESVVA